MTDEPPREEGAEEEIEDLEASAAAQANVAGGWCPRPTHACTPAPTGCIEPTNACTPNTLIGSTL